MMATGVVHLYVAASAVAVVAYGVDKVAAKMGARRIPEVYLQIIAFAGGWPGALLAQQIFRHKCSKRSFQVTFWSAAAANSAALLAAACLL
ncbi:DUF1294 domain-containing protein [Geomonas sp. RF6]|uniref:DUF1294 domain-containing protein n=1 Tax=Geomonas sp. RF6 TaxID=2897342 RepID=UPI001E36F5DA|nr:DUF1294 domain-containing protein [Geomonas sp. RF6]UFS69392.1 DUF1294 domain-containing protein [Geomonas sp. RF6]